MKSINCKIGHIYPRCILHGTDTWNLQSDSHRSSCEDNCLSLCCIHTHLKRNVSQFNHFNILRYQYFYLIFIIVIYNNYLYVRISKSEFFWIFEILMARTKARSMKTILFVRIDKHKYYQYNKFFVCQVSQK